MSAEIPSGLGVLQRIQEVLGEYFASVRRDGYVVDGVDEAEAASLVLALFTEQLDAYRKFVAGVQEADTRGCCPVCSYLWSECTCGVTERES